MITEKYKTAGVAATDSEKRRDLTRVECIGAATERPGFSKNTPLPAQKARGQGFAPVMRGFSASHAMAKASGAKGARPSAHGHSRHK